MAIRFDDDLAKLPATEQRAVTERAAELIAEEAHRANCAMPARSQEEIAKKLHINQAAVSKLERRTDM